MQGQTAAPVSGLSRFMPVRFHARGGLGEVLLAHDVELNRPVAIKRILGEAAADPEARARFLLEAEITGRLEHPGVVPVYGLGADPATGRPYYAMRFISGQPMKTAIDEFHAGGADFASLAFRKLLSRFVSVCQTLSFAHSRGVIHRDVKPSNIMIGAHGETLLVDWGIAKVLGSPDLSIREDTLRAAGRSTDGDTATATQTGSALGTPGYMSPEQASGNWEQLGPATDVYALGATLYQVLTGRPPLADKPKHAQVMLTIQGKVPAAQVLEPRVPTALSAIAQRAMIVDPSRRYASAEALAGDVERWLADEPVSCVREGPLAKAKRWARGHPTAVGVAASVVLVSGLAAGVGLGMLNSKNQELAQERDRALAAEQSAETARKRSEADAERLRTLVREYSSVVNSDPVFQRPNMVEARVLMRKLAEKYRDQLQLATGRSSDHSEWLSTKLQLARAVADLKNRREAVEQMRDCIAELETVEQSPPPPGLPRVMATCQNQLGRLLSADGAYAEAERCHRAAIRVLEPLMQADSPSSEVRIQYATAQMCMGLLVLKGEQPTESERLIRLALAHFEELVREEPSVDHHRDNLSVCQKNLGVVRERQADRAGAEQLYRAAVNTSLELLTQHPSSPRFRATLVDNYSDLGRVLYLKGDLNEAERVYRAAVKLSEKLTTQHPEVPGYQAEWADVVGSLAVVLRKKGVHAEAERLYVAARQLREKLATDNPEVVTYRADLATLCGNYSNLLWDVGRREEAEALLRRCVTLRARIVEEHPAVQSYRAEFANALKSLGILLAVRDRVSAMAELRRAAAEFEPLANRQPRVASHRAGLGECQHNLAALLRLVGDRDGAIVAARSARAAWTAALESAATNADYGRGLAATTVLLASLTADRDPVGAVELLRSVGPSFRASIPMDENFAPLQSREDYRALLAEWERTAKPKMAEPNPMPKKPGSPI